MDVTPGPREGDWSRPSDYERWYGSALGRAYLASLERVLAAWIAATRSPTVLDIGCGPGLVARQLFPQGMRVVGVDCSVAMAHRAQEHARLVGQPQRVVAGTVEALPFAPGSFPFALCVNCLEFVEERERAFGEIARVLAPGGTAIVGVLNRRSSWEGTRRLRRPVSSDSYYEGRFFTREELTLHLDAAGFDVEQVELAVRFPPLPGFLARGLCGAMDRLGRRWAPARGAVILCRAVKRLPGNPAPRIE
jgi:SAM-dependent methyltransferase